MREKAHHQGSLAPWPDEAAACAADCDRFIAGWQRSYAAAGGELFCRRGCSGCCSLVVNCSLAEVRGVAATLTATQRDRLHTHVQRLLRLADNSSTMADWLRAHRREAGGCPFLDYDGACGVYAQRPLSCRALLATKEPRWCTADFGTLPSADKQAFMAGLDRSIVAFPLHYVAATRGYAEELEHSLLRGMQEQLGFAIYGNLPVLAWLESTYALADVARSGDAAVEQLFAKHGVRSPFLVTLCRQL